MSPQPTRRGFTLVELMLAVSLLTLLLGSVAMVTGTSARAFRRGSATSTLEQRATLTLDSLTRELERTRLTTLAPDPTPGLGVSTLRYVHALDFAAGEVVESPPRELRLELASGEADDGLDNDGDGLVDERTLMLLERVGDATERRVVVAHDVAELLAGELANGVDDNLNGLVDEAGFVVERRGNTLEIQATLSRATTDGVEVVTRTVRSSIMLRN